MSHTLQAWDEPRFVPQLPRALRPGHTTQLCAGLHLQHPILNAERKASSLRKACPLRPPLPSLKHREGAHKAPANTLAANTAAAGAVRAITGTSTVGSHQRDPSVPQDEPFGGELGPKCFSAEQETLLFCPLFLRLPCSHPTISMSLV